MNRRTPHACLQHMRMMLALAVLFASPTAFAEDALPPVQPAAPTAASAPSAAQPPSGTEWQNDDADIPPPAHYGDCNSVPHPSHFIYDFSRGSMSDYPAAQPPALIPSRDTSQRLLLKGDCFGLLVENLDAHINSPYRTTTIRSVALIAGGEGEVWEGYGGLGETFYRSMGQDYSLSNFFFHIRGHIVENLSGELSGSIPLGGFFVSNDFMTQHPNDPRMNGMVEVALRLDWKYLALKLGVRTYQVSYTQPGAPGPSSVSRDGGFIGVTLKY